MTRKATLLDEWPILILFGLMVVSLGIAALGSCRKTQRDKNDLIGTVWVVTVTNSDESRSSGTLVWDRPGPLRFEIENDSRAGRVETITIRRIGRVPPDQAEDRADQAAREWVTIHDPGRRLLFGW